MNKEEEKKDIENGLVTPLVSPTKTYKNKLLFIDESEAGEWIRKKYMSRVLAIAATMYIDFYWGGVFFDNGDPRFIFAVSYFVLCIGLIHVVHSSGKYDETRIKEVSYKINEKHHQELLLQYKEIKQRYDEIYKEEHKIRNEILKNEVNSVLAFADKNSLRLISDMDIDYYACCRNEIKLYTI